MPVPDYFNAASPITLDVANIMLPTLTYMAQGAGVNNVSNNPAIVLPPKPNVPEWCLGLCVRQGLFYVSSPVARGQGLVDRFTARYGAAVTSMPALVFPADIATATAAAASLGRTLAEVYRTAAHVYLAMRTNDAARFFVPSL
jgi:hypothetical protein